MVTENENQFEEAKDLAIKKLAEAYEAISDLVYYSSDADLESMGDALLEMRSSIRLIFENE